MAKLPGKRSRKATVQPSRLYKAQREYVEKKLTKRQASYFRKLTPSRQKKYAEEKLTARQRSVVRSKSPKPSARRPLRELPAARHDVRGRPRLTVEQRSKLATDIKRLREAPTQRNLRRIQFIREQARQGRTIRATQVEGFKQWRTIARGLASKDKSAHGAKARALVLLGLRDPDWGWDVGDTPEGVHYGRR